MSVSGEHDMLMAYRRALGGLVDSHVEPAEFERSFIKLFVNDKVLWDDSIFIELENFFFVVEDFTSDETLRNPGDPTEAELYEAAARLLRLLDSLDV